MISQLTAVTAAPDHNATLPYFALGAGLNASEDSEGGGPVFPAYIRTATMTLCLLILGVGVVGNVMVPLVILKSKDLRNSTNIFLLNLSVADLMVLLVCTPTVLVEVNSPPETWVLGREMCKAVPFVEMTVAHASVLTILAISFERYYAICEPLKAGYVCTKTRAFLICVLAWGCAALFTSPMLVIAEYRHMRYVDGSIVAICLTEAGTFWTQFFFIMVISVFFFVPLLVLLALYAVIARHLMADPGSAPAKGTDSHNLRARRQVVLMLGTVVFSFFVCLLPFRVLTLWIIVVPHEAVVDLGVVAYYNLLFFCRVMLYLNSAVNPILYNLMSSKFRGGFVRLCGLRRGRRWRLRSHTLTTSLSGSGCRRRATRASPDFSWRSASLDSRASPLRDGCDSQAATALRKSVMVRASLLTSQRRGDECGCSVESYV